MLAMLAFFQRKLVNPVPGQERVFKHRQCNIRYTLLTAQLEFATAQFETFSRHNFCYTSMHPDFPPFGNFSRIVLCYSTEPVS